MKKSTKLFKKLIRKEIKKSILKEGKVWERGFGEPLPTLKSVQEKHNANNRSLKEDRAGVTKALESMLGDFFGFMKTLDTELPKKAKDNPAMKKDLAHLMQLKKLVLKSVDEWSEFLIEMDEKYPG